MKGVAITEAIRRRDELLADPNLGSTHEEVWRRIEDSRGNFDGKRMRGKKMEQHGEHVSPRGIIFLPGMFLPVFFIIAV